MPSKQLLPTTTIKGLRGFIKKKFNPSPYKSMMIKILNDEYYKSRPNDHASYIRLSSKKMYLDWNEFNNIISSPKKRKLWEEFKKLHK